MSDAAHSAPAAVSSSESPSRLRIVFVGTGVSTAIPVIGHFSGDCACALAIKDEKNPNHRNNVSLLVQEYGKLPTTPAHAIPVHQRDEQLHEMTEHQKQQAARYNPTTTAAASTTEEEFGWHNNVLIDIGKTFRSAYFKVLAPLKITTVDAVVLTHEHADAILGMDDIRDIQKFESVPPEWYWRITECMPVFCSPNTLSTLSKVFSYIVGNSRIRRGFVSKAIEGFEPKATVLDDDVKNNNISVDVDATPASTSGGEQQKQPLLPHGGGVLHPRQPWETVVVKRRIAALDFMMLDEDHGPFEFAITPGAQSAPWYGLPCEHGAGYLSLGFAFGSQKNNSRVVYLSDLSDMSETVLAFLKSDIIGPIDCLIVDCLLPFGDDKHFSHWSCDQMWQLAQELQPRTAYGTGMWCAIFHEKTCAQFGELLKEHRAQNPNSRMEICTLAHDGLTLEFGQ